MNKGQMYIRGDLLKTSLRGITTCFRPYGMIKWLDSDKLNVGVGLLFVLHNDIYIDLQHKYFGREETIKSNYYLKCLFSALWLGKFVVVSPNFVFLEVADENRRYIHDTTCHCWYFRIPKWFYGFFGPLLERKYVKIK